jgi:hypothetical protein
LSYSVDLAECKHGRHVLLLSEPFNGTGTVSAALHEPGVVFTQKVTTD